MGPIGCPKTSVRDYHYSLRNNPEQHSSQPIRADSFKSQTAQYIVLFLKYNWGEECKDTDV